MICNIHILFWEIKLINVIRNHLKLSNQFNHIFWHQYLNFKIKHTMIILISEKIIGFYIYIKYIILREK